MSHAYPFYALTEGDELEQGDILLACPVIVPDTNLSTMLSIETIEGKAFQYDVIVLTQSCDLANDKITEVVLCPHFSLADAARLQPELAKKEAQEQIRRGNRFRYHLLPAAKDIDISMSVRIVDFGRLHSLPKRLLRPFAAAQGQRLRLCPPYREHLSQAFARFFMRVGLPQDIELP